MNTNDFANISQDFMNQVITAYRLHTNNHEDVVKSLSLASMLIVYSMGHIINQYDDYKEGCKAFEDIIQIGYETHNEFRKQMEKKNG